MRRVYAAVRICCIISIICVIYVCVCISRRRRLRDHKCVIVVCVCLWSGLRVHIKTATTTMTTCVCLLAHLTHNARNKHTHYTLHHIHTQTVTHKCGTHRRMTAFPNSQKKTLRAANTNNAQKHTSPRPKLTNKQNVPFTQTKAIE